MKRLLIFDFDGLILDTEAPVYDAWQEIYGEHGHALEFEKWAQCIGTADVFDPCTDLRRWWHASSTAPRWCSAIGYAPTRSSPPSPCCPACGSTWPRRAVSA